MSEEEKAKSPAKVPPTFLSKAWLKEEEPGVYRLYRDVLVEGSDGHREKIGKPIPLGKYLREVRKGQQEELNRVVVQTFHPTEKRPLQLIEADDQ